MAVYAAQGRLLRSWRVEVRLKQAHVAARIHTAKATISQWEHAERGITFEALDALDDCYNAGGALADMAQALGTPSALPARERWLHYPGSRRALGWALLRPLPGRRSIEATLEWGPIRFELSEECDSSGLLLQMPIGRPDVTVGVQLRDTGWVDFGRGAAPAHLGIPVLSVPADPRLRVRWMPPGLASPRICDVFMRDAAFEAGVLAFFGCRPDLIRQVFRRDGRDGRAEARAGSVMGTPSPRAGEPVPRGAGPGFTGPQFRALRHGRCLTRSDVAAYATELLPSSPIDGHTIRRLENGATPRARLLRSRLDVVYEAGGFACADRVEVDVIRPRFVVRFPQFWIGPVWFELCSDRQKPVEVGVRQGAKSQSLTVAPDTVLVDERERADAGAYTIECPTGWIVRAGTGARPGAPSLDLDRHDLARTGPGPHPDVHPVLLQLFDRSPHDLVPSLRARRSA